MEWTCFQSEVQFHTLLSPLIRGVSSCYLTILLLGLFCLPIQIALVLLTTNEWGMIIITCIESIIMCRKMVVD